MKGRESQCGTTLKLQAYPPPASFQTSRPFFCHSGTDNFFRYRGSNYQRVWNNDWIIIETSVDSRTCDGDTLTISDSLSMRILARINSIGG